MPSFGDLVRVEQFVLRQLSAVRKSRSCDQGCHRSAAISEILNCFPKMVKKSHHPENSFFRREQEATVGWATWQKTLLVMQ